MGKRINVVGLQIRLDMMCSGKSECEGDGDGEWDSSTLHCDGLQVSPPHREPLEATVDCGP